MPGQAGVAGSPCTYEVSPGNQTVPSSGATGMSLTVTAGSDCAWSATSSVAWITVPGATSGRGSGSVGFNVAANAVLRFGDGWAGGIYFVEVIQGAQRKLVKVIKAN